MKMNNLFSVLLVIVITYGCTDVQKPSQVKFDQVLADSLIKMAEVDQTAAWVPEGKFKEYSQEEWAAYQDSVFTTHKKYAEAILNKYGFPGFDLVGEKGSKSFWLLVQHADSDPAFQEKVLTQMKKEVDKGNANKSHYAYLVDRVRLNTGRKLVYGTQVTYNSLGQAIPRTLEDSVNVNVRRAEMDLGPIEEYLNEMTLMHFEMNKENLKKNGIIAPKLYEIK